jgi:hypothetical protein
MHLRRLWIASGLFVAFAAGAAVIYKWTDADGVVHYSDQAVPGAEKMTISGAVNGSTATHSTAPQAPASKSPGGLAFTSINIDSPAPEEVFFGDNAVPVHLNLEPALQPGQTITWHLNGKQLDQAADSVGFTLPIMPRGTYVIAATVIDPESGQSQSTNSVTFYVRQPSELSPQHKNP